MNLELENMKLRAQLIDTQLAYLQAQGQLLLSQKEGISAKIAEMEAKEQSECPPPSQ